MLASFFSHLIAKREMVLQQFSRTSCGERERERERERCYKQWRGGVSRPQANEHGTVSVSIGRRKFDEQGGLGRWTCIPGALFSELSTSGNHHPF
jgi:bisphosphoglycerate-dependent phosphoglycerate mutase